MTKHQQRILSVNESLSFAKLKLDQVIEKSMLSLNEARFILVSLRLANAGMQVIVNELEGNPEPKVGP